MAFLNLFKKGRKEKKREEKKREEKKKPAVKKLAKVKLPEKKQVKPEQVEKKEPVLQPKKAKRKAGVSTFEILRSPQITEKATLLQNQNDYIFKAAPQATKPEIKKAVEEIYNVDVLKVRTINVPRKSKRLGRTQGWKQGYKKAIVRLKKGQTIEIMPR